MSKHTETHFTAKDTVRDIVIGMSDGLTVPFALAAGLSGAVASCSIVVTAGVAEIAAGAIAMGLGGYLAAQGDAEHYVREYRREHQEVKLIPEQEKVEVREVFREFGLRDEDVEPIVESLSQRPSDWVNFMMRFELGIERPKPQRAVTSALTIAVSYVTGGLVPLVPYMLSSEPSRAMMGSVVLTLIALFTFGYAKGKITGAPAMRSALQTVVIGGLAAGAAFGLARIIS
jgi:VIT1/CCC1 family predicted Fe2+/Mn2+ transporter